MMRVLKKKNAFLEKRLVKLCEIEPHFKVLEVGFGPGVGLKAAYEYIKDGPGQLYGTDFSERMVEVSERNLCNEIAVGKVHLNLGCVTDMPYANNTFDRIMHCNCYYFWPDMDSAVKELNRVITADGKMVCVLNLARLQQRVKQNMMQCGNIDPDRYMKSLEKHGFKDIHIKDIQDKITFQAIFATAAKET